MYLDANNLYGWAMSQHLPTGGFKWLSEQKTNKIYLNAYRVESKKGVILEVYIKYQDLHNIRNNHTLGPDKINVRGSMLSSYCKMIQEKYNISIGQVQKLLPTLSIKKRNTCSIFRYRIEVEKGP